MGSKSAAAKKNYPIKFFESPKAWEKWLAASQQKADGVWLRFFKKGSGVKTIFYDEALDVALCYGWIDGQAKSHDERSWVQKFTPRRARSMWSKRNKEHVARLIKSKKMRAAGLREIANAKKDGRWDAAYDPASSMVVPEDFLKRLAKDKKAERFFETLNRANTYAIAWRLQTAKKPETREGRMKALLEMLSKGEKLH
jgi:uncharacterized protein YdeI (YjbR/CyaY-like superfamily)